MAPAHGVRVLGVTQPKPERRPTPQSDAAAGAETETDGLARARTRSLVPPRYRPPSHDSSRARSLVGTPKTPYRSSLRICVAPIPLPKPNPIPLPFSRSRSPFRPDRQSGVLAGRAVRRPTATTAIPAANTNVTYNQAGMPPRQYSFASRSSA